MFVFVAGKSGVDHYCSCKSKSKVWDLNTNFTTEKIANGDSNDVWFV